MIAYRAQWIVPVCSPPIRDGVLLVEGGRIAAVGPRSVYAAHQPHDLGDVAVLPGFINAHTHLELCHLQHQVRPAPFWNWIEQVIVRSRTPGDIDCRRESVAKGAALSLATGVTCVGDISRTGLHAPILAQSPIRKVCFLELINGAKSPPNDIPSLTSIFDAHASLQNDRLRLGISPHAPYSVSLSDLKQCVGLAARHSCPLTMHYLETAEEFVQVTQDVQRYPPRFLAAMDMQRCRPLLAHVNYIDGERLEELVDVCANVVWCPRTHLYFGHPPHRWREMLARGINVCVGTDSLASNPGLSILDELRLVYAQSRDASPIEILEMGTIRAARALHWEDQLGSLARGKCADFVSVHIRTDCGDPIREILESQSTPAQVWIAGQIVHAS